MRAGGRDQCASPTLAGVSPDEEAFNPVPTYTMKSIVVAVVSAVALMLAVSSGSASAQDARSPRSLEPFGSDRELRRYLRTLGGIRRRADMVAMAPAAAEKLSLAKDESITNTQHAGVDEGGIVKLHGNYLIVLRRGRLFTIDVGDKRLQPISTINAFAPGLKGGGDWYDELLTYKDRIIVVGYSYARGGTEINAFRIDDSGRLTYESSHHLRSNDYYSAENYASRLVGGKLVFYAPLYAHYVTDDPLAVLPALRRWNSSASGGEFRRIASARRVYRAPSTFDEDYGVTMHTVTTCDLDQRELACEATVVMGPEGRVFYVSPTAVYVWTSDWRDRSDNESEVNYVYRLPLDGSAPTALGARGSPVDQFSFLEADGYLNVAVRSEAYGDAMWASRFAAGDLALLRVPLREFGDGKRIASHTAYRVLPQPSTARHGDFTNRFVGQHLLYGTGNGWGVPRSAHSPVYVVPIRGDSLSTVRLEHGVDRIEVMGRDAVVIGSDSMDLHFTGISLDGRPRIAQRFVLREASQGETRSHGFFYKPNEMTAGDGVFGLPVRRAGRPGYEQLATASAAIVFVRNSGRRFEPLGDLGASDGRVKDDRCEASCVDWYGNSRPLFLRGRTFALLGYELVEGETRGQRIREVRRVSFAP